VASAPALFSDVQRPLSLYLRAVWGRPMNVRAGSAHTTVAGGGPPPRVSIVDGTIQMPRTFAAAFGRAGVVVYRAAAAHAAAHLVYSTQRFSMRQLRPVQVALVSLVEDARVEQLAIRELPGLRALWLPFHKARSAQGADAESRMARLARALLDGDHRDDDAWVAKGRALFAARAGHLEDPSLSRDIGVLLGNDLGQMRVQFNAKTYVPEPAYRDDNCFLWDVGAADEPAPGDARDATWRTSRLDRAGSDQSLDAAPDGDGAAEVRARAEGTLGSDARSYAYDEWDFVIGLYRRQWCTVRERLARTGDGSCVRRIQRQHAETVERLARVISRTELRRARWRRAQLDGDRLDLDASIRATVDQRSGRAPDPRVHERQDRDERDLAALLLLDLSQSTTARVPGTDVTVLTLAREAAAVVADAMARIGDSFAIHGFHSDGRHEVAYYRFKEFDEPYDEPAQARLAGMAGQFSTRMGAAIRHAGSCLSARRAGRRLILLVTDGAPHDVDVYDRRYLVDDARRAVQEQTRRGIATFCLSLDPSADAYVRRIFGAGKYLVLDDVRRLPERLPWVYLDLTRS